MDQFASSPSSADGNRSAARDPLPLLDLIAEGIKRIEQVAPVIDAGCDEAQGYLFARPVEADAIGGLIGGGRLWMAGPALPPPDDALPVYVP